MQQTLYLIILMIAVLMTGCAGSGAPKDATDRSHDAGFDQTMRAADSLYNNMQFRSAYDLYLQMLDTEEAKTDNEKRLNVLNSLCMASELAGHKAEQTKWLQQQLDLARQTGNAYHQSTALLTMGKRLFYEGDQQQGIKYVNEAIEMAEKTDLKTTDHLIHSHLIILAGLYDEMKDYDNALKTDERNLQLTKEGTRWGDDPNAQLIDRRMALAKMASVLTKKGDLQRADSVYNAWKAVQYEGNHARDYFIVDYLRRRGRYQETVPVYQTLIQQVREHGDTLGEMMNTAKWGLAWVYKKMGNYQQATELYSQVLDIQDTLKNRKARKNAQELAAVYKAQEQEKTILQQQAEIQRKQLVIVSLMAVAIIALLIGMLIYRHTKNRRLKEQFLLLQEARHSTEAGQAIRRAFVNTILQKLKSPINVLRGYARIFNNPAFQLKPEDRPKRYNDILAAARSIESLMDPMLDSFAQGTTGITDEERTICTEALRSPLLTLINTAEIIIDGNGQIPQEEYMQLRADVCHNAYHVATSTHQLILFSLYGDDIPTPKQDRIGLNEVVRSFLNSYDLHPSAIDKNRIVATAFKSEVADDVMIDTNPLLQDLLNCLLDNADKYATGGTVLVSCHEDAEGTYAISVTNEGPVIPAADAERIFEPFVRLSSDEHSLGIGLPLARRLAVSMGYTVTLDMTYTKGARFVVSGIA